MAIVYTDLASGRLISRLETATTSGTTIQANRVNGSYVTFPTGAFFLFIKRVTETDTFIEKIKVASASQAATGVVTLGTMTRNLSLTDGTDLTGTAATITFPTGTLCYVGVGTHDLTQTVKKNETNTITEDLTIESGNKVNFGGASAYAYSANSGTDLTFKDANNSATTLSQLTALSGEDEKAAVDDAATPGYLGATDSAGILRLDSTLTKTDGGDYITVGLVAPVTVAKGGTGATSITANGMVLGAGTSAVTTLAPGTSGNVAKSNGTIWTSGTVPSYVKTYYNTASDSATAGASSDQIFYFDTHTYTIPANDLVAGVSYEVLAGGTFTCAAGNLSLKIVLGTTAITSIAFTTPTSGDFVITGNVIGTAAAGSSVAVRGVGIYFVSATTVTRIDYGEQNCATDGTLVLKIGGQFDSSNGGNGAILKFLTVKRVSTTAA